jgi:pimeloyl-ACP methyl ester carboxylesterase
LSGLPVSETRIDLAGVSTAVLVGGEGPPIVALHGPGEFAPRWLRVIPSMASTHRVVIPDLPGHGMSDAGDVDLTEALVMKWLEELIARTCAEPPTLVGHILGGAIAARFAIGHADRIERLVLVDSLGLARFRPSLRFALGLLGFILRPTERSYDRFMTQCEYDRDALAQDMGEDWAAVRDYALELAGEADVRAAMRRLMARVGVPPIPPENLAGIDVPTTLIWGRHDRALPLSIAETASERYGWPLHVIEDAADDAPMEQPSAFAEVLRAAIPGGDRSETGMLALDARR